MSRLDVEGRDGVGQLGEVQHFAGGPDHLHRAYPGITGSVNGVTNDLERRVDQLLRQRLHIVYQHFQRHPAKLQEWPGGQ